MESKDKKKGKANFYATWAMWLVLFVAGIVIAGIELLSGERHWSVVPTGKGAIDQAISPDETLLVVLNAGENSLSFLDLKSKIPFFKLYLPLPEPEQPPEGEEPSYLLESVEFSGDGSRIFVTCTDGRYFVIDPVLLRIVASGELLEPGLLLSEKGRYGEGILAIESELGKLSFVSEEGELPIFFLGTPFSLSALDLVEKKGCASCSSTLFVAFQEEASSVLTVLRLSAESFEVLGELRASLPEGAFLGDIQRGEGGFLLGVFYPQGAINLLWLADSGEIEIPAEPTVAPEGQKIFRLSRSGIFITNPSPGLVTLATYDKEGEPIVLDLKPCGFDGVKIRSFSSYPNQPDSFALSVGPHQGLFGVSSWEGVVVFDSSGQEILGLGCNCSSPCQCAIDIDFSGLDEDDEEKDGGMWIHVNWDDDDNDGWVPNDHYYNAQYSPDWTDLYIYRGDDDFFELHVSTCDCTVCEDGGYPVRPEVTIEYSSEYITLYTTWDKKKPGSEDESSKVDSGSIYFCDEIPSVFYVEGVHGTENKGGAFVKATLRCGTNVCGVDKIDVTVVEVNLVATTGFDTCWDQKADNEVRHKDKKNSNDKNGVISWDDANGDMQKNDPDQYCQYFHACCEFQGTIKPKNSGLQSWDIKRDKYGKWWGRRASESWGQPFRVHNPWVSDDSTNDDEDLTPSAEDHIYSIDGPGLETRTYPTTVFGSGPFDFIFAYLNFREYVYVDLNNGKGAVQCSDFVHWHFKMYVEPVEPKDDSGFLTRGGGYWEHNTWGAYWIQEPSPPSE